MSAALLVPEEELWKVDERESENFQYEADDEAAMEIVVAEKTKKKKKNTY